MMAAHTPKVELEAAQPGFALEGIDGRSILSAATQDALDAQGASDEVLEDWTMREQKAWTPVQEGFNAPCLRADVRHTALLFLSHATQQLVGLPQKSWFEASTLLDVYHLKTMTPDNLVETIDALPATCAALVAIVKKMDCATALVSVSSFVTHAQLFAKYLHGLGYTTVPLEVTDDMINKAEHAILKALAWRIVVPTTECWTSTFCARFNVLTRSSLVPSLNWVWQQGLFGARLILMQQAPSGDLPPKVLAAGLLAVGLVGARLLPLEDLKPAKMTSDQWFELYQDIQPQEPQPQCVLPPNHSQCLLELLAVTVGVDLAEIKESGRLAALAMREAVKGAQDLNRSRCGGAQSAAACSAACSARPESI